MSDLDEHEFKRRDSIVGESGFFFMYFVLSVAVVRICTLSGLMFDWER